MQLTPMSTNGPSALVEELLSAPPGRALLQARNSSKFWLPAVCEELLQRSQDLRHANARLALLAAELAVAVAERLSRRDLQLAAFAALGNSRRICGDLGGARSALDQGCKLLPGEGVSPALGIRLERFRAALAADEHDYPLAVSLYRRCLLCYRALGDPQSAGQVLISLGRCYSRMGKQRTAAKNLIRGLETIDPHKDLGVFLAGLLCLAVLLSEEGRGADAMLLLRDAKPLLGARVSPILASRVLWAEAKAAESIGRDGRAERGYKAALECFLGLDMQHEAAIVGVDLAAFYLARWRLEQSREVVKSLLPILETHGFLPEMFAANGIMAGVSSQKAAQAAALGELLTSLRSTLARFRSRRH